MYHAVILKMDETERKSRTGHGNRDCLKKRDLSLVLDNKTEIKISVKIKTHLTIFLKKYELSKHILEFSEKENKRKRYMLHP